MYQLTAQLTLTEFATAMDSYDIAQAASMFLLVSGVALKIVALADHEAKMHKTDRVTTLKPMKLLIRTAT